MIGRLAIAIASAATVALAIRDRLAARVSDAVAPAIESFAEASRSLTPTEGPAVDEAPKGEEIVVSASAPAPRATAVAIAKPREKSKTPTTFVVTKDELEAAVAAKGWGASASAANEGLALHHVGRFAKFGIAEGDVLVSANGRSLRTADEALATLGALGNSRSIVVVLRRGDASYSVPITLAGD